MTYTEIKDAVQEGRRISGKAHEELLWYQLRELDNARRKLADPAKIQQRERDIKTAFEMNTRHEEIAAAAVAKINELRIITYGAATDFMKSRTRRRRQRLYAALTIYRDSERKAKNVTENDDEGG